jgi:hypothetical protein
MFSPELPLIDSTRLMLTAKANQIFACRHKSTAMQTDEISRISSSWLTNVL